MVDRLMTRIAIIGGGPAALLLLNELSKVNGTKPFSIDVFESGDQFGPGLPYSSSGALAEHVTNVSSDELPKLPQTLTEWVRSCSDKYLAKYGIHREEFHEKEVVPRLLFGDYLSAQFEVLLGKLDSQGHRCTLRSKQHVEDIERIGENEFRVSTKESVSLVFDIVVISTGHHWPLMNEGQISNYFDSPYPPEKLKRKAHCKVVIRGSSLTAVDAIKTLALTNGEFSRTTDGIITYKSHSTDFAIEMHSRGGLLPALRVHMDEPHMSDSSRIADKLVASERGRNDGFVTLDFLFEHGFLKLLKESQPEFFESIKDMSIEEFVERMLANRDREPAFDLLRREYKESLKSIERTKSVPWKEALSALSFAMNYPAKYLSAEDMLRLKRTLMPFISVIIAFLPQTSCETLLALHDAGVLTIVEDGDNGSVEIEDGQIVYSWGAENNKHTEICQMFVDCVGQKAFQAKDFPFKSLLKSGDVTQALLPFRSVDKALEHKAKAPEDIFEDASKLYLRVPGLAINDYFQAMNKVGEPTANLFILAVPYLGGYNPDYSGLDFCEQASKAVVSCMEKAAYF